MLKLVNMYYNTINKYYTMHFFFEQKTNKLLYTHNIKLHILNKHIYVTHNIKLHMCILKSHISTVMFT